MFRFVVSHLVVMLFWFCAHSSAQAVIKRDLRFDGTTTVSGTGTLGSGSTLSVKYGIYYYCIDDTTLGNLPCLNSSNYTKNFQVRFDVCEGDGTTCSPVKTVTNSESWSVTNDKKSYTESITLPNTVKNGTRWIRVALDSGGTISETNEGNNLQTGSFSVGEKPDLSIKTLTVSPTSAKAGDTVTVSYQFCNDGKAASSVDAKFRFYYSTDTTINTSDTYLNKEITASINAGSCTTIIPVPITTVTIPTTATATTFYIGVIADYDAKEAESNENNNTKYATLTLSSVADLVVKTLQLSTTTVQKGIAFNANYQVCNQGGLDVTTSIKFRFYYSLDATVDTNDTYLNQEVSVSLKAGACHPTTGTNAVSLSIPTTAPFGTMYVGLIADYDKKITESNENNNVSSVKITFKDRDEDEDGVPADQDCNDKDKAIYPRYNNNPAATEVCDGKDNDCNGTIDDIADLGKTCTDTTRKGVCQAGTWACVNKVKTCKQTTASSPEVCDGKDNNCDGMIDNGVNCSETVAEPSQEAVTESVQPDESTTTQDGGVTDTNTTETTTQDGGVTDTTTTESTTEATTDTTTSPDTDPGESTAGDTSSPNNCDTVTCNAGEFCRAGQCYKACGCTKCDKGKSCKDGVCVDDSCGGVTCPQGQICEASSGQCIKDQCDGVSCNSGEICIEGSCQKDPCASVKCYNNQVCYLGQCYDPGCQPNQPQEPVAEPADETTAEPTSEPAEESGTTEQAAEPTSEPAEEKTTEDAATQETATTADNVSQETAGNVDTTTGSGNESTTDTGGTGGCGCQAQQVSWPAVLLLFVILLFAFPLRRRAQ